MNLKELIEACGFDFRSLSLHTGGKWIAKGGLKVFGHWKLFNGETPEEAVEKLLKALHETH